MMKKAFGIILCTVMLIVWVSPSFVTASESAINKYALPAVTVGGMVMEYYSPTMATGVVNGHNYFYTCGRGGTGVFNVSDIDDKKLVATYRIPQFYAWGMLLDSKGIVWMTGNGKLIKYDPYNDNLTNYGTVYAGEMFSTGLCIDDEDNIYVGTYPNAKIIKFDRETESFVDLGMIHSGASYVRSLAYCNGYIYAGTFSNTDRKFIRINKNDYSDKKEIKMENSFIKANNIDWIYYMSSVGDLVFCTLWMKNSANQNIPSEMIIYDTASETFLDYDFEGKAAGYVSQAYNGKAFFYAKKGYIHSIDLTTKKIENTGIACNQFPYPGSRFITLKDTLKYPNPVLVTQWNMLPLLIEVESKTQSLISIEREGSYMSLSNLTTVDDMILVSADATGEGATYDIKTGEKKSIALGGQAEAFLRVGNKMYVGGYPGGYLYCTDLDTGKNINLGRIAEDQSRPFAMSYGDDKIFMGTVPEYGELGGVIAWYDLKTSKMTAIRNVIPNQSIINLIYNDGKLYGSSSVYGGPGSSPTETNSKIFIYDPKTQTLIKSFTPNITGLSTIPSIRGLKFDNDGNLWVVAGQNLFQVNPQTEEISNLISFGIGANSNYEPCEIIINDNLLYVNIDGLRVVNLNDFTYKDYSDYTKNASRMTIGEDGNIYFISPFYNSNSDTSYVEVVPILDYEVTYDNLTWAKKLFSKTDNLGLYIGNPLSYANGKIQYIDSSNEKVAPVVENGRTLVPLRFIAESLGANVSWDDIVQTATLKKGSLNVSVTINKSEIMVNGEVKSLDVPAQIKEGRTLLPLRAVADAFSKQVFWDNSGIIIISDKSLDLTKEETSFVNLYLKYYMHEDYLDEKLLAENAKDAKLINLTDFEEESRFSSEVVPGFTVIGQMNAENTVATTDMVSYNGNKSLKILEKEKQEIGVKSDYIAINPQKTYMLNYREMIDFGRLYLTIEYYDKNKSSLNSTSMVNIVTKGKWNLINTEIPLTVDTAYIRLFFNKPNSFSGEGYVDSVVLYEK